MPGRPRRRSFAVMERDHQAADLYRRGLSFRAIASEMGWSSPQSALNAVRRAARDAVQDPLAAEEALALMLERLQDYRRMVHKAADMDTFIVTRDGEIVLHPETGEPLRDASVFLHASDRLVKIEEHEARLRGLYAPAKSRVEVITEDVIDREIAALKDQLAAQDAEQVPADSLDMDNATRLRLS